MKKNIVKKLNSDAKSIKVIGQKQGDCRHDCEHWNEVSGKNIYYASMMPCYSRVCTGYYTYDSFWTSQF